MLNWFDWFVSVGENQQDCGVFDEINWVGRARHIELSRQYLLVPMACTKWYGSCGAALWSGERNKDFPAR